MHRSTWLGVLCVAGLLAIAGGGLGFTRHERGPAPVPPVRVTTVARAPIAAPVRVEAPAAAADADDSSALIGPGDPAAMAFDGPPAPDADAALVGPPALADAGVAPMTPAPSSARPHRLPAEAVLVAAPAPVVDIVHAPTPGERFASLASALAPAVRRAGLALGSLPAASAVAGVAALLCALIGAIVWHVHSRRERMFRSFARGRSVAEISRTTHLAQDAVRTLLRAGGQPSRPARQELPVGRIGRFAAYAELQRRQLASADRGMGYERATEREPSGTPVA